MNSVISPCALRATISLALFLWISSHGQGVRLLSQADPGQIPAGAGGDSFAPILSPDGRYVLFASTANNLLLCTNGIPIPLRIPQSLNAYVRDRVYGTNTLVSVNLSGAAGGNGDSLPMALSADGRYVAFESSASDLVPGDTNNASDIFVRDLLAGSTILVSVATNGAPGNGASRSPALTPDGRFVAFVSLANNLVPGDTNGIADVFVRDLLSGTTVLASVGATPAVPTSSSESPDITGDGRYVAFYSTANNLVAGFRVGSDIYIRDLSANTTILASAFARTAVPSNNVICFNHAFSSDGHLLVYEAASSSSGSGVVLRYNVDTGATDLVGTNAAFLKGPFENIRTVDINGDGQFIAYLANYGTADGSTTCVTLWDAQSGSSTIVSTNLNSAVQPGSLCFWPALDASGRYVAFVSSATNLVTNAISGEYHLYFDDTQTGNRVLIDAEPSGLGSGVLADTVPRLASDARFVAFDSGDANLVPNDRNKALDVFLRDMQTGTIEMISAHDPALPTETPNGHCTTTAGASSADGRYLVFASEADNLVANDTNGFGDVFIRDLATGTTLLVSTATNGFSADGLSSEPAVNGDGSSVVFTSAADNLVAGDNNRAQDVFIRDLQAGTTRLVSLNAAGSASANNHSYSGTLSTEGRFVLFRSKATDLAAGAYASGSENLFLRDLPLATNYALTTAGVATAVMTPDGHFVAFADAASAAGGRFFIWDSLAARRILTNASPYPLKLIAIATDGNRFAYWSGYSAAQLYVADRRTGTNWTITPGPVTVPTPMLRFSADGQALVYNRALGTYSQVFKYDFRTGANVLVSQASATGLPANGASDSPVVSADGRFVAYRSAANNLVTGDVNEQPDIFLYDSQTGINTLLSANRFGNSSADNRSLTPFFSGDGSTLFFESWASDIAPSDYNNTSDLFASTLLTATLLSGSGSEHQPIVSWPWVPGRNYRVEYKGNPAAATWQELPGTITNIGVKAFLQDASPSPVQRIYRVLCY